MSPYLFSKKIKCKVCQHNYRGVKERNKRKYFCSGYHNHNLCKRYIIREEQLLELILNHQEIERNRNNTSSIENYTYFTSTIRDRVDTITIDSNNNTIHILYINNTETLITPNHHMYWNVVQN